MKTVLITTTIYVPRVLELYRKIGPSVPIIVVGDQKTPHQEAQAFVHRLGNAQYYSVEDQEKMGYKCSPLIGWNRIMRRNIAVLEATRLKPDCVVTIDDDNIPVSNEYFSDIERIVNRPFSGLCAEPSDGWFNAAEFLEPKTFHRGFPYSRRHAVREISMRGLVNGKVGVAAGLWAGDPDIDAMTRIAIQPTAYSWARLMDAGMVVSPSAYAPFNTQNTAFAAEVAALMSVWIAVGRYDDIWASYACQRVMRDLGYLVHFGAPFVWQQRNVQNLWKNLGDEMLGMQNTDAFIERLDQLKFTSQDPTERLRELFQGIRSLPFMPQATVEAGIAFCDDFLAIRAKA